MRPVQYLTHRVLFIGALFGSFAIAQEAAVDVDPSQGQQFFRYPSFIANGSQGNNEASYLKRQERKLDSESKRIVREYSRTDDSPKRRDLEANLKKVVTSQFAIKQQIRKKELAELEAQLKRLRDRHQRRIEEEDRIVADRVQQLLRDAEGLGWGTSASRGGSGGFGAFGGNRGAAVFVPNAPVVAEPVVPAQPGVPTP